MLDAALAARGAALPHFTRDSELRVHEGFQGVWHWQLGFALPERLHVVLKTAAEDQTLISDGERVRSFVGGALISEDPASGSDVAALARFVALVNLDVLADTERVEWQELAPRSLSARFRAHPDESLRLSFDTEMRLALAEGPAAIPGLGTGFLRARFDDYRRVAGRWLPFEVRYEFRGAPLLDERVSEWRPEDAPAVR